MLRRAFFIILVFANALLIYDIFRMSGARARINDTTAAYADTPAEANLTVVEFFDYACDLCKQIDPVFQEALKRDGKIRHIPKPLPSPSQTGAKYVELVYAAGLQGAFMETHRELIGNFRALDEARTAEIAQKLGLDLAKLKADAKSVAVAQESENNVELVRRFYVPSLPAYVVGNRIVFAPQSPPAIEDFLRVFAEARERK